MPKPTPAVDGPFRIYVEQIPTGATLDVEAFVEHVVHDVVEALLSDEYADRLDEIAEARPTDPHEVQRPGDLRFESLVADLVALVDTKMPVYGWQVLRLANRLLMHTPSPSISQQRVEGGAAA
ncbi:hypothetical protein [Streptomyces sp. NPDC058266]|uniref:hypothetical protein n=1 Tax=Streptomyces sp. NPDC058266 TaxID=3346412 RepID=UPI0036EE5F13